MIRDGQTLSGDAAVSEGRRCLTRGVMLGGNETARQQSPGDVAAFFGTTFNSTRDSASRLPRANADRPRQIPDFKFLPDKK